MSEGLPKGCVPQCRGCPHRSLSWQESLDQKMGWLRSALATWENKLQTIRTIAEDRRWGYREKTCLHVRWNGAAWEFGLLAKQKAQDGRWHEELVPIPDCPAHSSRVRAAIRILSERLPPSAENFPLVFVVISGSLLTFVLKTAAPQGVLETIRLPRGLQEFLSAIGIDGVWLNYNPAAGHRVVSSRGWRHLWGAQRGRTSEGLVYGPGGFQQVLGNLSADSLDEAQAFLEPRAGLRIVDLYSGIGSSLVRWRRAGAEAIGVELSGECMEAAELNAGRGACLQGRAEERIPQLEKWCGESPLAAYVNPPRQGLEPGVVDWLSGRATRIAYLSCNATSQARDLGVFGKAGYAVRRIIPYDFFPNTRHVETLALLELDTGRPLSRYSDSRVIDRPDR